MKYLVQVRDDVEAGDEKMKELEQEMKEWGIFVTDFCLGDIMVDDEDNDTPPPPKKNKLAEFPVVEGEESIVEYVGQYKKACLSKKALLKNTRDRLEKDKATGHERLILNHSVLFHEFFWSLRKTCRFFCMMFSFQSSLL